MSAHRQRGISLMEISFMLALVAGIVALALMWSGQAERQVQTTRYAAGLERFVLNVRAAMQASGSAAQFTTAQINALGLVPQEIASGMPLTPVAGPDGSVATVSLEAIGSVTVNALVVAFRMPTEDSDGERIRTCLAYLLTGLRSFDYVELNGVIAKTPGGARLSSEVPLQIATNECRQPGRQIRLGIIGID